MKILSKSFIIIGMIVLALSWSAKLSFAGHREDAIRYIEQAINALDDGYLRQASRYVMNAARSSRRFNRKIFRKLKRIARKIRRRHRRRYHDDNERIMRNLENIRDDLEEEDDDDDDDDDEHLEGIRDFEGIGD